MSDFGSPTSSEGNRQIISTADPRTPAGDVLTITETGWENVLTAWTTANLAIYEPVYVRRHCTILDMGVQVVTQNGNLDVGIYTWAGTRIVSSGSTAMGAAGFQKIAVADTALSPGWYFFACATNSTTAILRGTAAVAQMARSFGFYEQTSAFALPATATFATYTRTWAPVISGLVQTNG